MNDKDLVWLPKSLVKEVKKLESDEELEKLILKHIEDSKLSITAELAELDDQVLMYRGLMVKARNEFKKAKDEELESFTAIWDHYEKDIKNIRQKVEEVKNALQPLKNEVAAVKGMMNEIYVYDFKTLIGVIREFSQLYGENKNMIEFLINNYKPQ